MTQLELFCDDVLTEGTSVPLDAIELLRNGAHLVLSISGGKDSQAMSEYLIRLRKKEGWTGEVHFVHADLGRAEWGITEQFVTEYAARKGIPLHVVKHTKFDLIEGIRHRMETRPDVPPFPSSAARYCTSDWKRSPIDKWIRNQWPADAMVVCAIGMRAGESPARAKRSIISYREAASATTKNRDVYDWLPIHDWAENDVWETIYDSDCISHPAYTLGNERLSCALCVLGSVNDLLNGAINNPDTYRELCQIEMESGFSFRKNLWLGTLKPELLTEAQTVWYMVKDIL